MRQGEAGDSGNTAARTTRVYGPESGPEYIYHFVVRSHFMDRKVASITGPCFRPRVPDFLDTRGASVGGWMLCLSATCSAVRAGHWGGWEPGGRGGANRDSVGNAR